MIFITNFFIEKFDMYHCVNLRYTLCYFDSLIYCDMVADVGTLDLPPYAYRPGSIVRVEISFTNRSCKPVNNDIVCC